MKRCFVSKFSVKTFSKSTKMQRNEETKPIDCFLKRKDGRFDVRKTVEILKTFFKEKRE